MDTPFESLLQTMMDHSPAPFYRACRDVCDTAYAAKTWFETYGSTPTAADIVALTALIMQREREIVLDERIDGANYDDD